MSKKLLAFLLAVGILILPAVTALYAQTQFPDEIIMDYNPYVQRRYTPPEHEVFVCLHGTHNTDYKISCGECHHDKDGNFLKDLKIGDDVKQCVECHTELNKTAKNEKSIMLLENAIHGQCKVCHKKINIEAGDPEGTSGPAPVFCKECHVKVE